MTFPAHYPCRLSFAYYEGPPRQSCHIVCFPLLHAHYREPDDDSSYIMCRNFAVDGEANFSLLTIDLYSYILICLSCFLHIIIKLFCNFCRFVLIIYHDVSS